MVEDRTPVWRRKLRATNVSVRSRGQGPTEAVTHSHRPFVGARSGQRDKATCITQSIAAASLETILADAASTS